MIYTELVVFILGVSVLFYVVFGGADFGAGILEIFTGQKGVSTISKAIAPVREANHIWLIIAVVILFNGFPKVYSTVSIVLHIPVFLALIGIIFRGAAFTFRHYDAVKDSSQQIYSVVFRYSSLFSTIFLGIILGALVSGTLPEQDYSLSNLSFYQYFVAPWFNPFCFSIGLFVSVLSAYIASIFLLGEVETDYGYGLIAKFIKRLFWASVVTGSLIFVSSYYQGLDFHLRFLDHSISIGCAIIASAIVPFIWIFINRREIWSLRILGGVQVVLIVLGWLANQWPNLLYYHGGGILSIHDASAEQTVMKVLLIALIVGILLIFPALYFLFRVFKVEK